VLIASDEKMQNSMALADGYFAGQPATFICFGELQYKNSGVGAGLKSASIGGKVLADDATGEIGFVDFDDSVPAGYTQLVATVERVNNNVVTVFFGLKTLLVEGTGVAVTEKVTTPVATPGAGAVAAGTPVALTTATPGARILYTLDGAEPDSGSAEYRDAITVDAAVTIKAVAIKAGAEHSGLLTAAYTIA
jgi:hypothetical protein